MILVPPPQSPGLNRLGAISSWMTEEAVEKLREATEKCGICRLYADMMDLAVCKALFPDDPEKQARCQEIMRARREGRLSLSEAEEKLRELGITIEDVQEAIEAVEPVVKKAIKEKIGVDLE